jgi:serine/threonine-protein kinase
MIVRSRLKVIRSLGEGGMGSVFEVEHLVTKHRRALKILRPELAQRPALRERFLREASAAGRIGSPHIVETFDTGELDSGEPYLLMELLQGRSLGAWLKSDGKLRLMVAVELAIQACEGLEAAHQAGIVHRDIKPDNLFVTGDPPFVKVLDFGISKFDPARTYESALTVEGTPLGTPFYMPPEQVRGGLTSTPQSDIYSLGVVLYECVTGKRPFEAASLPELGVRIHQGRYKPASELVPDLPKRLDALLARALAPKPERRHPSARALAEDLRQLASDSTASATVVTGGREPERATGSEVAADTGPRSEPEPAPASRAGRPPRRPARWPILLGIAVGVVVIGAAVAGGFTVERQDNRDAHVPSPSASEPANEIPSAAPNAVTATPTLPEPPGGTDAAAQAAPAARTERARRAPETPVPRKTGPAKPDVTRAGEHKLEERDPY